MTLPDGFVFSQSNLQDYRDCPRRFQLRYLERRAWPAAQSTNALDSERRMHLGHAFHRLMRQLHTGVAPEDLEPVARADPELAVLWDNYQEMPPQELPSVLREPELTLGVGLCGYRLEARYDLLAGNPGGRWVIVDWKTSLRRASRRVLRDRVQTHVYPYVLVCGGTSLNADTPIAAQQVEMVYWFAGFPGQPERLAYDSEQLAADSALLEHLVHEIETRPADGYPQTDDRKQCKYCVYASLCWDDVLAGQWDEQPDVDTLDSALDELDLEDITPIPF